MRRKQRDYGPKQITKKQRAFLAQLWGSIPQPGKPSADADTRLQPLPGETIFDHLDEPK